MSKPKPRIGETPVIGTDTRLRPRAHSQRRLRRGIEMLLRRRRDARDRALCDLAQTWEQGYADRDPELDASVVLALDAGATIADIERSTPLERRGCAA